MTTPGPVIGVVVNPVAGVGGPAGLAGSDGAQVQRLAGARGGRSAAVDRATRTLTELVRRVPTLRALTVAGEMGAVACERAGVSAQILPIQPGLPSTAEDTRRAATALAEAGVELLIFAGGDGTAADVARGLAGICGAHRTGCGSVAVLGIPAGVKMYSGCFAVTPGAAAQVAAELLIGPGRPLVDAEVVDLDEDEWRTGRVRLRLTAAVRVPASRAVQAKKSPGSGGLFEQTAAAAAAAAALLDDRVVTAVGPGGTTAALLDRRRIAGTLLGVDLVQGNELLAANVSEAELFAQLRRGRMRLLLSVIGGQGFLFGRGNQQFSPRVIAGVDRADIVVIAPEAKLAELAGRPLLVDTGDAATDRALAGYLRVLTGPGSSAMYPIGDPMSRTDPPGQPSARGSSTYDSKENQLDEHPYR